MNFKTLRASWIGLVIGLLSLPVAGMQGASGQGTPVAEESPSPEVVFGVYPAGTQEGVYFEDFVEPGESHEFTLALENAGTSDLKLLVYPADVYSMTNGGMGVNFQDQERTEPTTWLDVSEGTFDIASGEELLQPFTVTVPEGTSPGQYVTAIAVETADSFAIGDEGGAFRQVLRKVVAVVVLVPGEAQPSFSLGEPEVLIQQGQTVLRTPVENTGNIRVRPAGNVTLHDSSGAEVATGEVAMGSVYMGDTTPFEIWLPNALPVGEYLVSVELTDADTEATASFEEISVNVVPEPTPEPEVESVPVVVPAATPEPVAPVTVQSIEIVGNADPIQFANVAFEIENTGNHISRSRVKLAVSHDGELVDEFAIDDNLPLPVGTTSVEDRYIPPTGWESGTWTFSITVHAINANAGVETVVVNEVDVAVIEVP